MPAKKKNTNKPPTKTQVMAQIAERTGLTKTQATEAYAALVDVMAASLRRHKEFTVPGLFKVRVVRKPAREARPGRNPFTGESIMIKAKPASNAVKVRALKGAKDMA
jgi:nucleoid DNA-binding protein